MRILGEPSRPMYQGRLSKCMMQNWHLDARRSADTRQSGAVQCCARIRGSPRPGCIRSERVRLTFGNRSEYLGVRVLCRFVGRREGGQCVVLEKILFSKNLQNARMSADEWRRSVCVTGPRTPRKTARESVSWKCVPRSYRAGIS